MKGHRFSLFIFLLITNLALAQKSDLIPLIEFRSDQDEPVLYKTQSDELSPINSSAQTNPISFRIRESEFIRDSVIYEQYDENLDEWRLYARYTYEYNSKDQRIRSIYELWNEEELMWTSNIKYEFAYDGFDNEILDARFDWDDLNEKWVENYRDSLAFNDNNVEIFSMKLSGWDKEMNNWTIGRKYEYEQDEFGNQLNYAIYNWDSDAKKWSGRQKQELEYNSDNKRTEEISFEWNSESNSWDFSLMNQFEYDLNGKDIAHSTFLWSAEDNEWEKYLKSESTFSEAGKILSQLISNWNVDLGSWINESRYDYSYVGEEQTTEIDYLWDTNTDEWKENAKSVEKFNTFGLRELYEFYSWDLGLTEWKLSGKSDFEYDQLNNQTLYANYSWDSENGKWTGIQKFAYAFDDQGNRTKYAVYNTWDSEKNAWIGSYKYEYLYDDNKRNTMYAHYNAWDSDNSTWIGNYKYEYVYDEGLITDYYRYTWSLTDTDWSLLRTGVYYYSAIVEEETILEVKNLSRPVVVFPNPTLGPFQLSNQLNVQSVRVFDLNGRLQKEFNGFQNTYNIQDLHPGIYSVLVQTVEGTEKFKIIKR